MSSDDVESEDAMSTDSIHVVAVTRMCLEDSMLSYECMRDDGVTEIVDRSDLMDGGTHQKLVLAFERQNPPPWDTECIHCEGVGCEECICDECERPCRHINGVNYGCVLHPVI